MAPPVPFPSLDTIVFAEIRNDTTQTIVYSGDSEVGMLITINILGDVSGLEIYNLDTRESLKIDSSKLITLTGHDMILGDQIIISTVKGNKYISLLRNGSYVNILNTLNKNTDWFQLAKGDNILAYTAASGLQNLQFMVTYKTVYEGI